MCVSVTTHHRRSIVVATSATAALIVSTLALAQVPANWSCTGQPVQIGSGDDPEKETIGFVCLAPDVEVTGSTVIRAEDGKWTIGQVGATSGDPEHDTFGYQPRE